MRRCCCTALVALLAAGGGAVPTRGGVVSREAGLSVDGGDDLVDGSGHAVKTDTVESHENLFAMVAEPMEKLAKLKGARFFHARPPPPAPVALLSLTSLTPLFVSAPTRSHHRQP